MTNQKRTRPLDRMFDALAHPFRRDLLVRVGGHGPRDEDTLDVDALDPPDDSQSFDVALDHAHLPKLADAGYVAWDREAGTVERGPEFDEIEPLLDLLAEHREELPDEWP